MTLAESFPQSRCLASVATGDITPPVGIYHRMWGAAVHDRSTGVHRPLRQTTLALAPEGAADPRAAASVFISVDHCLFWHREMSDVLHAVAAGSGISADRITVFFTHTHAAGLMGYERRELPGGDLIPEYLRHLCEVLAGSVTAALDALVPADIVYGTGHCDLAQNRDLRDPDSGEYVCGYRPGGMADKTVLVARVTERASRRPLLTLVNYACHPTTLAWDNTLISPDYLGAMREVVESHTGAPTLFVQGASGDIGPREGFVGDVEVADRNGRMLGYAVLSTLETLPPAGTRFEYAGPVVSGATIGTWEYTPLDAEQLVPLSHWDEQELTIPLSYGNDLPRADVLLREQAEWKQKEAAALAAGDRTAARDARAMIERATRRLTRVEHLPPGDHYPYRYKLWRIGDAIWIALDGEHYNVLQRTLRERFPQHPLMIGTLANGSNVWYLPDERSYGKGLYQESASVLAQGSLEQLIDHIAAALESMHDSTEKRTRKSEH